MRAKCFKKIAIVITISLTLMLCGCAGGSAGSGSDASESGAESASSDDFSEADRSSDGRSDESGSSESAEEKTPTKDKETSKQNIKRPETPKVTHEDLPKTDYVGRKDDLVEVPKEVMAAHRRINKDEATINWDHMYSIRTHEEIIVCTETFQYEDNTYVLFAMENTGLREVLVDASLTLTYANGTEELSYGFLSGFRVGGENGTYSLLYLYDFDETNFNIKLDFEGLSYPVEEKYDVDYDVVDEFDLSHSDWIGYRFQIINTGTTTFRLGGENIYVLDKKGDIMGFRDIEYNGDAERSGRKLAPGGSFEDETVFFGLNDRKKEVSATVFASYIDYIEVSEEPGSSGEVDHGMK